MYHRVLPDPFSFPYHIQPGMYVTPDTLKKHVTFLKQNFEVVFLEDLVKDAQKGKSLGRRCAITFDDGWRDNFDYAYPILEEHGIPATIFLATGFLSNDEVFWPEKLCYYLEKFNFATSDDAPFVFSGFIEDVAKGSELRHHLFYERAISLLKSYSCKDIADIISYFEFKLGKCMFERQVVNQAEVQRMHSSGLVRFGAHTHNHVLLNHLDHGSVIEEVLTSRCKIEEIINAPVVTFSYPNGNYNPDVKEILAQNGFIAAVTTTRGFFTKSTSLLEIPRIAIHQDVTSSVPSFRSRILIKGF